MDLKKAARDPWVWGQTSLMLVILLAAPLLPRHVNLGDADFLLNRIDPDWIRWLGAIPIAAGAGLVVWGVRSLGPSLTPGIEPLPTSLYEAIRVMEKSDLVADTLGEHVFDFFLRNKRAEWDDYRGEITRFELERYLPGL